MGAIPIVFSRALFADSMPSPDAAIYIDDFQTMSEAAEYIALVQRSEQAWRRHTSWKTATVLSKGFVQLVENSLATLTCRLCELVPVPVEVKNDETIEVQGCAAKMFSAFVFEGRVPDIDQRLGFDAVFVMHYTKLKHRYLVVLMLVFHYLTII